MLAGFKNCGPWPGHLPSLLALQFIVKGTCNRGLVLTRALLNAYQEALHSPSLAILILLSIRITCNWGHAGDLQRSDWSQLLQAVGYWWATDKAGVEIAALH